ncbi:uncharacterized protein BT62DRAFT_1011067 [Guyanagaster necrorhizus]|uniref:Uncharacterized protein n=1 Tax=Guyanagaster necrorhizus TaxID=856835 RepID=A0A9P7VJD9_9AGAR|nr:uncharacterized protein BT62DRAFT_1011067 [Guyanagaster necrorhizus MCA 3950]KAG7441774.1 hypothetical protein BT62DRAFT_1011067 [Guyanagaster necrorhizus MCA 3950]
MSTKPKAGIRALVGEHRYYSCDPCAALFILRSPETYAITGRILFLFENEDLAPTNCIMDYGFDQIFSKQSTYVLDEYKTSSNRFLRWTDGSFGSYQRENIDLARFFTQRGHDDTEGSNDSSLEVNMLPPV